MKAFLIVLLLFGPYFSPLRAEEKSALQQMLEKDQRVRTRESVVLLDGVRYKKFEVEGEFFFLSLKAPQTQMTELICGRPTGFESESLIEGAIKIRQRKTVFVEFLRQSCHTKKGQMRTQVSLDPRFGIYLGEDSPNSVLKNKKLLFNPFNLNSATFSADF